MTTLWIGSYPPAGSGAPEGQGEGIWRVDLHADGSLGEPRLAVRSPAPSFVVPHPNGRVLYAVQESRRGRVAAFRVHDDGLEPLGTAPSGGAHPCHLLVHGQSLYVANYGDGVLGVVPLAADGSFASDEPAVLGHTGSGPRAGRQDGPHAHFVAVAPGGHVLVVDLGTDEIRRYARTPTGLEPAGVAATLPPGTGPRHLAFDGWSRDEPVRFDGHRAYVAGEFDATVHVLAWDVEADCGVVVQSLPTTAAPSRPVSPPPADGELRAAWGADPSPAPSHVALDGADLLVATRGPGVLSRFAVTAAGGLEPVAEHVLPTRCPRHFAIVDGWIVVAEQQPGAVTVLARDGRVVASRSLPSASCVVGAVG